MEQHGVAADAADADDVSFIFLRVFILSGCDVDTGVLVGYMDAMTYSIGPEDPDPDPE